MSFGFGTDNTGGFGQRPTYSSLFGGSNTALGQSGFESQVGHPAHSITKPFDELSSSLARLLTSGSYSDLTIICGDDQYEVHRALVCPRSAFFEAACKNNFKEAVTGKIDLSDDDSLAVKMMVHYFYHLNYPISNTENCVLASSQTLTLQGPRTPNLAITPNQQQSFDSVDDDQPTSKSKKKKRKRPIKEYSTGSADPKRVSNLTLHAKVYALGEKYGISGLKTLSIEKFEDEVRDHWDNDDFILAAREVYTSTMDHDRIMRNVVLRTLSGHLSLLDKLSVQGVMKDVSLGFDLLMHLKSEGKISAR